MGIAPTPNPSDVELNFTNYYDPDSHNTVDLLTAPPNGFNYVTTVPPLTTNARVVFVAGCYAGKAYRVLWGFPADLNTPVTGRALVMQDSNYDNAQANDYVNLRHAYEAWIEIEEDMVKNNANLTDAVSYANAYMAQQGYFERWKVVMGDGAKIKIR